jgi:hypothetical protein
MASNLTVKLGHIIIESIILLFPSPFNRDMAQPVWIREQRGADTGGL